MNRSISFRPGNLLNLSLLVVVLLSSCSVSRKYQKEASAKWSSDIIKFEQQDKIEADPDSAILFAGSSSIRLWSTLEEDAAPYPVIQRGFGGSKFSDLAVFAKEIVYPHKFRALVVFEANDITGDAADKSAEEVAKLFREIVRTVRKKYPEKPIFLIEITPTKSRWHVWQKITEANRLLKESCLEMHKTYFIETSAAYLNNNGEPRNELFINDRLHLNHEGYKIWGTLIRNKLDEVLKQSDSK